MQESDCGSFAWVQVAKQQGIKTINVVRRRELADELKAFGYVRQSLCIRIFTERKRSGSMDEPQVAGRLPRYSLHFCGGC